jgi:fumarylacetoacetate (FAA) hydrolase
MAWICRKLENQMKLASLKHKRDGKLMIVDQKLERATDASDIAPTLQATLDDWQKHAPKLQDRAEALARNTVTTIPFVAADYASPLPRAYQWADGSAYVNHVELVRKARGAVMPERFWTDPLMYQGGSDSFLAPYDDILMADASWGIDFEGEVAVITDDVPMGVDAEAALSHIKLVMICNDVSLRNLIPAELEKGFGFFQSKPSSSFAPVALTPDELGDAWQNGKLHLPLRVTLNDKIFGAPNAGVDMVFDFGQLIAHAAKTRPLVAGSIIGSGTISNLDRTVGSACIAEVRMLEIIADGKAKTPFLQFGDKIEIEMFDKNGLSLFGKISQTVRTYQK